MPLCSESTSRSLFQISAHSYSLLESGSSISRAAEHILHEKVPAPKVRLRQGVLITRNDAYSLLQKCEEQNDLECARRVQFVMVSTGLESTEVLGNKFIRLFVSKSKLVEACQAFDKIAKPTTYAWSAIISGNVKLDVHQMVFEFHNRMQFSKARSDSFIYLALLKACSMASTLQQGRIIHEHIMKDEFLTNVVVLRNNLIDMYAKCGSLPEAYEAFQRMCNQSVVSWNSIITGYAQHGDSSAALALFQTMKKNGFTPDRITFLSLLKACANRGVIGHARFAHDQIINSKIQVDIVMGSAMIDMYAKCGSIVEANRAFYKLSNPNIFSWSTVIAAHAEEEESFVALVYFEEMQQGGIVPNDVTFLGVLKACTCIGDVFYGRHIHCQIIGSILTNNVVLGTTLIDMYAKCGSLEEALKTFDKLPMRNGISWGAIIEGYYQDGQGEAALNCFQSMQQERVGPDIVTFLNVLKICTNTGDVVYGRLIHQQVITSSLQLNLVIGNSLIDMYAKCRRLEEACIVLDSLRDRNVVSWGAIIAGYVQHGESILALRHFKMMQEENINPDMVTLSCVLRACANTGNIEQGRVVHDQIIMRESELDVIIGSALVDMYVKCGRLDEAHTIFKKYPYKNVISWGVMIGGYAQHGEGLLALQVFEQMLGEGIKPDGVSFTCLLFACTHSGLVEEGHWYFRYMKEVYNIMPNTSHFACMVDLLGRAGFLREAEAVLQSTIQMNIIGWTSLLNACCMHGDRELGKHCFEQVGILDPDYVGGYLLISNMYAS